MGAIADGPNGHLTIQLLTWASEKPRTYGDAMDAWRTSCPRLPIWEDAVSAGLIRVEPGGMMRERRVSLTADGRKLLNGARASQTAG